MASILAEIRFLVASGNYIFSAHALDQSQLQNRPNQAEAVDILKSGWHNRGFDEQDVNGRWKYRITGRARTGKEGSVVVTILILATGRRLLVITVF